MNMVFWEDEIVWLYGGDELSASWLGLILVSCILDYDFLDTDVDNLIWVER